MKTQNNDSYYEYITKIENRIFDYDMRYPNGIKENEPSIKNADIVVFDRPHIKNIPKHIEKELYKNIKVHPSIVNLSEKYYQENLKGKIVISVHYRHGNGEKVLYKNRFLVNKYLKFLDRVIGKRHSGVVVFLATDSLDVLKKFRERYGNLVYFREKWMPKSNSGPLHKHPENKNRLQSAKDALIDMLLLAKGNFLVHNYSSFNWYPQYISSLGANRIVMIK